jgi:hypothetical protein
MQTCKKCQQYSECKKLCDKAEQFTNQDFVKKKNKTMHFPNADRFVLQPHGKYKIADFTPEDDYSENSRP